MPSITKTDNPALVRAPWERQFGESRKAFAAFAIYRDLGDSRTIASVRKQGGKTPRLYERWSIRWEWQSRVNAWQAELDGITRKVQQQEWAEMARRQAQQAIATQQLALNPIAAVLRRVQQDPQVFDRIADLNTLMQWAMIGARLLPAAAEAERAARLGPEIAEQARLRAKGEMFDDESTTNGTSGAALAELARNPESLQRALGLVRAICVGEDQPGGTGTTGDSAPGAALAIVPASASVVGDHSAGGSHGASRPHHGGDAAAAREE